MGQQQAWRSRIAESFPGIACSLSLAVAAAIALPPDTAAAQTPRKGGKLVVARQADITSWDPKFTNDTLTLQAQHQIYANLLQTSSDGQQLRPSLAKSYEISPDSKVYTFKLRENAKFCNGA